MTTVLDALENAKCNFETIGRMGASTHPIFAIALEQLNNGIKALENGKSAHDSIQEHMFDDVNTDA